MRVAFLTMLETAGASPADLRASLRVGGINIARHQLSLALALHCERIVCVARGLDPDLIALQHAAEEAGARFHMVNGARGLVGLATATDEIFVLADGLLAAPEDAVPLLEPAPTVLVQPIEAGLPAGFERIDLNHTAAGAMHLPGRLVERLADLPADCDVASALQRIALQGGVAQTMLPAALRETGAWRLVRDEAEAQAAEGEWIRAMTLPSGGETPSELAVRMAVRAFGPALLHSGSGGIGVRATAALVLLLALGAGWFRFAILAFLLAAVAWVLRSAAGLLFAIQRQALQRGQPLLSGEETFAWLLDLVLITVIAWNLTGVPSDAGFLVRAFPGAILIMLLRVLPRAIDTPWVIWLKDRTLLGIVLTAIAVGGLRAGAIGGLAVAVAVIGAVWPMRPLRLTRT